jgi:hypothetical protein
MNATPRIILNAIRFVGVLIGILIGWVLFPVDNAQGRAKLTLSRPPIPPGETIIRAKCPGTDPYEVAGCERGGTIWLAPISADRETLAHERGHHYDETYLDDTERARFTRLLDLAGPWQPTTADVDDHDGTYHADAPVEVFADVYAHCRLDGRMNGTWRTAGRPPFRGAFRVRVCKAVTRMSATA